MITRKTMQRSVTTAIAGTILVGGTMFGAGAAVAQPATAATCPVGSWDAATIGKPAAVAAGMNGIGVYRVADDNIFSLRMSTSHKAALYVGSITSSDGTLAFRKVRTEVGDIVRRVSPHKIVFAMTNRGGIDGINVAVGCGSNVKFAFAVNGHALGTNNIVVGATGSHPAANPFTELKN